MTYKGAIDEVKSLSQNSMMPDIFKPALNKIAETLEMETIRPKGKWIDIRVIKAFHYDREPRVMCSRCGNEEEWSSNYCPNCGAGMRGKDYGIL